ncbi:MAG: 6-phosphogluconolactonase [Candidatus Zixiibacteriota bacterium]
MTNLKIFADSQAIAQAAGEQFFQAARAAIDNKGFFTVALSGGSTPDNFYKLLVDKVKMSPEYCTLLRKIHFFWGDEREVPPENSKSNYGNFQKTFLSQINIPEDNVHRIKPDAGGAQQAAILYEKVLKSFFKLKKNQWPCFDLILLGMGVDGHTASLFPGIKELKEDIRLVVSPYIEKFGSYRITLTVPVFNSASFVLFLVTGEDKAKTLREVIESTHQPDMYPAQLIRPHNGQLFWFVDQAAAKLLNQNARGGKKCERQY